MRWLFLPQRKQCHYIWNRLLKISITTLKYHGQFYLIQLRSSCYLTEVVRAEAVEKPIELPSCCRATPGSAVPQGWEENQTLLALKTRKHLSEKSKLVHVSPEQGFLEAKKTIREDFSFSDLQATDTSRKTQLSFDSSHFIDACCFTSFPLTQE